MKKYIFIAAVLSLAAAASCSKQDSVSPNASGDSAINFSSYSGRAVTKAATTDEFTVAASYNGSSYFTSIAVKWDDVNSVWNTDGTTYFWPVDVSGTKPMIFYGAMPSTLSAGASVSASSLAADSDIRTAYTKCTSVPNDGKVALAFSHQMAKVSFKLVGGDADLVYKVTAFSISAKNNGSVAPETGTWTPSGDATTYTITGFPTSVSGTTVSSEFGSTNLVPDQSATVSVTYSVETAGGIEVTSSDTKTATLALTGKHGTQTLYTLTLPSGASERKLSSEVTEWNESSVEQGWDETVSVLLPGEFSVSSTKKVKFTKGNLLWDGENFHIESSQTAYPTTWNTSHVGHFFWTNLTDYQSGTASYMPYASSYSYTSQTTSDKFWCGEDNKLTVDGQSGLYALSNTESNYLLNSGGSSGRNDANRFAKAVVNGVKGLIIFPDGYNGGTKITDDSITGVANVNTTGAAFPTSSIASATWTSMESEGCVFLPAAGKRESSKITYAGSNANYMLSTPNESMATFGSHLTFGTDYIYSGQGVYRNYGASIRLVSTVSE